MRVGVLFEVFEMYTRLWNLKITSLEVLSISCLILLDICFPCVMKNSCYRYQFSSVSCVQFFATPWTTPCQASLSITNSQSLLKLMSVESVILSNLLIFYRPLLLPSILPNIRVFSNESVLCIRWPKYWSFSSASIISMNIQDWFPLGLAGWSPCSPSYSPTPQFKIINSSVLSFL